MTLGSNGLGAKSALALAACVLLSICASPGCGSRNVSVGVDDGAGRIVPSDAGAPGDQGDASGAVLMCATSACSAPFITCPASKFPCSVDTSTDTENCGGCGNVCPSGDDVAALLGGRYYCTGGTCRLACDPGFGDCNGDATDGCETSLSCDSDNCGACGKKCAPGEFCHEGECGCPAGLEECNSACKIPDGCFNIKTSELNCGACGVQCPQVGPIGDLSLHLACGCQEGQCNRRKCGGALFRYADCNNPAPPKECVVLPDEDGCETNIDLDPNNCGACGHSCAPGQVCSGGECLCEPPLVLCGDRCVDLTSDPMHCGGCNHLCPVPNAPRNGVPICDRGQCGFACNPHFADCDGDFANGCEAPLDSDPNNCGACGVRCDSSVGQPCIRGRCAVVECPPETGALQ